MCTLTWRSIESGYEVFFNRDELKDRPIAEPPSVGEKNGVKFLAPRDTGAGGTWLLANEPGVTVAILNWYSRDTRLPPEAGGRSRGKLVLDFGDVSGLAEVGSRLAEKSLHHYRPFRLLAFEPAENGLSVAKWDWIGEGEIQKAASPEMPICSSSFDRDAVIASRRAFWNGKGNDGDSESQWQFHHGTDDSGKYSARSVRMNRPDAQTWSVSRIAVNRERIDFLYEAEAPNLEFEPGVFRSVLDRRADQASTSSTTSP